MIDPSRVPLFHVLAGNLSFQIEHHLFPDLPANRYAEISVEVQEVCERYGIPYNVGPLSKQFGSVIRKICRLSLPEPERRGGVGAAGVLLNGLGGATRKVAGVVKKVALRLRP